MRSLLVGVLLLLRVLPSFAQDRLLTIDDLYDPKRKINFNGTYFANLRWLNDGQHFLKSGGESLQKVNALTGTTQALFEVNKLQSAFRTEAGLDDAEARSAVKRSRLILDPTEQGLLLEYANDLFYYQIQQNVLIRLTDNAEPEREPMFSPSGKLIAFVRGNDLRVVSVADARETQLTEDGSPEVLNGVLDWVYQEEIFGRGGFRGFWWSPDSSRLAFLRLDEAKVPLFRAVDHNPKHPTLGPLRYPKAGDPNPIVRLGIVSIVNGDVTWIDLKKYEPENVLIVAVDWIPDSSKLVYQIQNRQQTWLDLNLGEISTGRTATILRETSAAWVNVLEDPYWLKDGSFVWQSERTGFRHLYHCSPDGHQVKAITSGDWEVRGLEAVDQHRRRIYFSGTRDSPLETHLYRVGLDGKGLARVSQEAGEHKVTFDPMCAHYLDQWSDIATPPQVRLFDDNGSLVRVISGNRSNSLREYRLGETEFVQIAARDGFVLEALMIRPPGFDLERQYPVLCYAYNGPHSQKITSQKVRNSWGGTNYLWHQLLAQKGYIIWVSDSRTASGKGARSAWPAYRNLGEVELRDLEDMLSWLRSKPFVDESRIGLWGWSYGGFMTAYALTHSKSFRIGIAGAPVTDWRFYDSVYTERYMGFPAENEEGYKKSSVLDAARNLRGKLLLIHGGADENVHLQNTYQLTDRLQKAGKSFELMIYPSSRHSITNPRSQKHMRSLMTDFIIDNL